LRLRRINSDWSRVARTGANVSAGKDALLSAANNLTLQAASNTVDIKSTNSSGSVSVGATFALGGEQNGISFQLGAQGTKGRADGTETTYTNTQIRAGSNTAPATLIFQSGGDTTLKGASATANTVKADIGGNLNIQSLQDKASYDSQQASVGAGISLCIPPICYGSMVVVNVNAALSKIEADHNSVAVQDEAAQRGQSGIKAGDGGFSVAVKGDATLTGGVISSTQAAVDNNVNRFSSSTLTVTDLVNQSKLDASSESANISVSSGGTSASGDTIKGSSGVAFGFGSVNDSQASVTKAGITGIAGNQEVRTGDKEAGLNPVFTPADAAGINTSLSVQTGVTAEFGRTVQKSVEFFTDEAYRVMFQTKPKYYKITCVNEPCTYDAKAGGNPNENIKAEEISEAEMIKLAQAIKNGDMAQGKIVLAINGIFNGQEGKVDRAGQLAIQNTEAIKDPAKVERFGETKPTVILLHYPEANNFISELMVAGYEKFLAKSFGYTNYSTSYANSVQQLAPYGLSSEGHSRGTLVQENAFNLLRDQGWQAPADMSVRMRGAAVSEAESSVSSIGMRPDRQLNYFSHPNDPVTVFVGSAKGDVGAAWQEWWRVFTTPNSAHSCYGTGVAGCAVIEAPFSYYGLGRTPDELNAIRQQRQQRQ
jgi:filamentous hemagglutinin